MTALQDAMPLEVYAAHSLVTALRATTGPTRQQVIERVAMRRCDGACRADWHVARRPSVVRLRSPSGRAVHLARRQL